MVVGTDLASSVRDRMDGYRLALMDAGISLRDDFFFEFRRQAQEDCAACAKRTLLQILECPNPPTAIFAVNDGIALELHQAARLLKIPIPEQCSLMGFDWLMRVLPSGGDVTTVSQPFDLIGRVAAQRLLARINSPSDPPRHVMFNAPVVIRETTGAPCLIPSPDPQLEPRILI